MKKFCLGCGCGRFLVLLVAILICGAKAVAETDDSSNVPVVTIQATEPVAKPASPGVFTVFRRGNTNLTLNVYFQIGGTASNGVDYALISNWVNISAGATSNSIPITPMTNTASNVPQTVILQLAPSPMMSPLNPVNYAIGVPSNAVVYIGSNLPPAVKIILSGDGDVFYTPTNIEILAKAGEPGGYITNVDFFAGATDLGSGLPVVLDPPGVNSTVGLVYLFNWINPSPGNYPLIAVATDDNGISTTSDVVNITVLQGPPTNSPPVVRIISPANGATFFAPVNIPLFAYSRDFDGSVDSVEFFAGTNSLGFGTKLVSIITNPPPIVPLNTMPAVTSLPPIVILPVNEFFLVWSNAPLGSYALTAVATDNQGATTTSDPVNITILPSPPPPTNRPPIVSIVATDPIAIEGTNGWVWPGETNSPPTWTNWPATVCRFSTNYGPKNATFAVRRFGDTNGDLAVTYDIRGTASNGVDYVTLPGSVTIPAGEPRALITIVPIDDGPPDVNKTVVLKLTPSTNTPPDYLLGFPRRAAAIIIDSDGPRPVTGLLPDGCFHLVTPGPDAAWFCIEYSTNLVNWTPVCTNQVIEGSIDFVDPDAPNDHCRFYRALPETNPPSD